MKKNQNARRVPSFSLDFEKGNIQEVKGENRTDNLLFTDDIDGNLSFHEFHECKFDKLTFSAKGEGCLFADVIFNHCDLSNISFLEAVCRRVEFHNCRLTGIDFIRGTLEDVLFENCECSYANFSSARFKRCSFQNTRFLEAAFSMCSFMHMEIAYCDFMGSELLDASLKGMDFSNSRIDNILVNAEGLKGVFVNEEQAVACAKLLGIIVK